MSSPNTSFADGSPGMRTVSVIITPLVVVSVVFPVLAAVSIYLRMIAKRRIRQPYHADDWWIIATWVNSSILEANGPRHYSADQDQFLTFPMSVLFWVFAAKSGVDAYDIDSLQGTYDSLEVRDCIKGMYLFSPTEADIPTVFGAGCVFDSMHASVAIIICEDIGFVILQAYFRNFPKIERVHLDCHWRDCGMVHYIHSCECLVSHRFV